MLLVALNKPPIVVAGMTPTTVKASFVSAVLPAGYYIKLWPLQCLRSPKQDGRDTVEDS